LMAGPWPKAARGRPPQRTAVRNTTAAATRNQFAFLAMDGGRRAGGETGPGRLGRWRSDRRFGGLRKSSVAAVQRTRPFENGSAAAGAWLVASDGQGKASDRQAPANQDTPAFRPGRLPLLGIDVWEHAVLSEVRKNRRAADYVDGLVETWSTGKARSPSDIWPARFRIEGATKKKNGAGGPQGSGRPAPLSFHVRHQGSQQT